MKHTPEPWNVYDSKPKQVRICRVAEQRIEQEAIATFSTSADAWRSILCVNALAGKNPEGVVDLVEALRQMIREVEYLVEDGTLCEATVNSNAGIIAARAALAKLEDVQ
jgi:hypothetical protein